MTDSFQAFFNTLQIEIEAKIQSIGLNNTAKLLAIQYCNQEKVDEKEIQSHRETIEAHLEQEYDTDE